MLEKIYVMKEAKVGEQAYRPGGIYAVDPQTKETLINGGFAVEVNFPSLDAIELAVERVVKEYEKNYELIKTHPKYVDAESLRQYELEQLDAKLEAEVEQLKKDYELEIETLEKEIAKKAIENAFKPDEQIAHFMDNATLQLQYSGDIVTDLQLLAVKINAMTDEQKETVFFKFGQLKQVAEQKANDYNKEQVRGILNDIFENVRKVSKTAQYDLQLKQLMAYRMLNVDAPYRILKLVKEQVKQQKGGN
ncbi:hypothetical protein [Geobacillus stearothermophilus]|uniref:hypothetical protein n=1 Tax=Geobacillus stearothermophilus TaxID=1422 RepID=UPI002E2483DC|nr:hypothetical protein [Geobacillus stearothermophilus]